MGRRCLEDIVDTMGSYVDSLKFAGGSFALLPRRALLEITKLCHEHDVLVSTALSNMCSGKAKDAVKSYIRECKEVDST